LSSAEDDFFSLSCHEEGQEREDTKECVHHLVGVDLNRNLENWNCVTQGRHTDMQGRGGEEDRGDCRK